MPEAKKIIHVHLKHPAPNQNDDWYFGSMKAIYDHLSKDDLGRQYDSLINHFWNNKEIDVFENNKCIIKKGEILRANQKDKE